MKRVLYITNIPVPYRVKFFNALARQVRLTVVFERRRGKNRDGAWADGEPFHFRALFPRGIPLGPENALAPGLLREVLGDYDRVVFGCCNSPAQLLAMLLLRLEKRDYVLNLDGEPFLKGRGVKAALKRFFLSGAAGYLVAGARAAAGIEKIAGDSPVMAYPFSSLTEGEVSRNRERAGEIRGDTIAVLGRYYPYKGLDVALEAARLAPELSFVFAGMGERTGEFLKAQEVPDNVKIIPFLQKEELDELYATCRAVVLPSRRECWGLVVGEAASFGAPVVSTWGSGAAAEYLADRYPQYLAQTGDPASLLDCIRRVCREDTAAYRAYLLETARDYTIEACIRAHLALLEGET